MKHLEPEINFDDNRYEPADGQYFRSFEEASQLIKDYCIKCTHSRYIQPTNSRERHKCDMLHELRLGMSNDYPIWYETFVKLERKNRFYDYNNPNEVPESLIACKSFKSKQLKFAFMRNQNQKIAKNERAK